MSNRGPFWRNVMLICAVHVIAVIGVVRWNGAASKPKTENIVWVSGDSAGAGQSPAAVPPRAAATSSAPLHAEATPSPPEEKDEDSLLLASAKSEIQLPAPTPTPTPTSTPNSRSIATPLVKTPPKASPRPPRKPKPTPRPTPKPTPKPKPKKTVLAKVSPRPSPEEKSTPQPNDDTDAAEPHNQADEPAAGKEESRDTGTDTAEQKSPHAGAGSESGSGGGAGHGGGTAKSSEFASYGRMLHDRFYSEWTQPTSTVASANKISTMVRVRIEKDGRVSNFEIIKPSGNVMVDESVAAMGKRVTEVDPLPASLRSSGHYDIKINFELNSD